MKMTLTALSLSILIAGAQARENKNNLDPAKDEYVDKVKEALPS
jgi:hypothetical protein